MLDLSSVSGQDDWLKYKDPSGQFEVLCPGGLMQIKHQEVTSEMGSLKNTAHFIQMDAPHPNHLYMITTVEYPTGAFPEDSLALATDFFEEILVSLEQNTNTKEQYHTTDVTKERKEMLLRLTSLDSKLSIKAKVVLENDVLYTLQAYTSHSNNLNEFLDQFINSFVVLN